MALIFTLERFLKTNHVVLGTLHVNGRLFYTLENLHKIIPTGKYSCDLTYSPRFHKLLPLVNNVSGRSGIRIHSGNTFEDTKGCILIGEEFVNDIFYEPYIIRSCQALDYLLNYINHCSVKHFYLKIYEQFKTSSLVDCGS